jgi:hypothetical protein
MAVAQTAAYTLHDPPIRWFPQDLPVRFYIHYAGEPDIPADQEFGEIIAGIAVWQEAALSAYGSRYGTVTTSSGINVRDGQNTISFSGGGFQYPEGVIYAVAVTRDSSQTFLQRGRIYERIVDTDIVLTQPPTFATRERILAPNCSNLFDLRSVLAQAWGRAIGLGTSDVVGATLYPSLQPCEIEAASPELDDIRGIRELYPESFLPHFALSAAPTSVRPGDRLLLTFDPRGHGDLEVDLYLGWILSDGSYASVDASLGAYWNQLVPMAASFQLPEQAVTLMDATVPIGLQPGVYQAFALATSPGVSAWDLSSWIGAATAVITVLP